MPAKPVKTGKASTSKVVPKSGKVEKPSTKEKRARKEVDEDSSDDSEEEKRKARLKAKRKNF